MPQSFASLSYHIIFSTKGRVPALTGDLPARLYDYMGAILKNTNATLLAAGGMPDHIHLLAGLSRDLAVAEAVRLVKSNSSKWIHETYPQHGAFAWQTGYAAFTVSYSNVAEVRKYIANQAEHHKTVSFREEFLAFLKRHNLEFDERYLWD